MTTRWLDLRCPVMAARVFGAASAAFRSKELLAISLMHLLLALLVGSWRLHIDRFQKETNAGGFPSLEDSDRRNDEEFEILTMEQDLLLRLNNWRQQVGVGAVGLQSDLLFLARRHSLRMIKLPFFGIRDPEEGAICNTVLAFRGSECIGIQTVRVSDRHPDPIGYCILRWMKRRRSRRIVLMPGFSRAAAGIVRNQRDRCLYVTCLLEAT